MYNDGNIKMGGIMRVQDIIRFLNKKDLVLRLYFTRKKSETDYVSYSPVIDTAMFEYLIRIIRDNLDSKREMDYIKFSPIGSYDGMIETYPTNEVNYFTHVIDSYKEEKVVRDNIDEKAINNLGFYCLVITYNSKNTEEKIMIFRRVTKFKKLSKKGIMGFVKDNRFTQIESNMLGIDGDVDIIVKDDKMLIFNHVAMERVFSISDQYTQKAKETMSYIKRANRIENFEQFEDDCFNDMRIKRVLAKLLTEEENLKKCFQNFSNVKKAIELFELEIKIIKVDKKDMIQYESKEQLMDIIRFTRDSFYTSIINQRNGIDNSL